jgi:hypothetical protein
MMRPKLIAMILTQLDIHLLQVPKMEAVAKGTESMTYVAEKTILPLALGLS